MQLANVDVFDDPHLLEFYVSSWQGARAGKRLWNSPRRLRKNWLKRSSNDKMYRVNKLGVRDGI